MSVSNLPLTPKRRELKKSLNDSRVTLWRDLLMTVELVYAQLERKLAEKDCTYPRFRLLFALYFDAPLSATQLALRLRVSRGNMSTFIKRLESDGLIYPCPLISTKGRPKYYLSPAGTKYAEDLMDFHFANIRQLPMKLSPKAKKDWLQLKANLEKFYDAQ
jgi:DNA-binding MarR family transcriptional regulator